MANNRPCWVLLIALACAPAAAEDLRTQAKALSKSMQSWRVTPKFHVGGMARFTLHPDGRPTSDKQGVYRQWGARHEHKSAICLNEGSSYQFKPVRVRAGNDSITVEGFVCGFIAIIQLGRAPVADDLTAGAIRRALGGIFRFSGASETATLAAALDDALSPIEIGARQTLFESILLDNPPGWQAEVRDDNVYFRNADRDLRVRSRALKSEELGAGADILLQETMPRRLLESARSIDPSARVLSIARVVDKDGLKVGSAQITYDDVIERHDWFYDAPGRKLFTIRGKAPGNASSGLDPIMNQLLRSVSPTTRTRLANTSDLPMPTALLGDAPAEIAALSVRASQESMDRGAEVAFTLDFAVTGGPTEGVRYSEVRSVTFAGRDVPGYPIRSSDQLASGRYRSTHTERIPLTAPPGQYEYRAQVCVAQQCQTQNMTFRIR